MLYNVTKENRTLQAESTEVATQRPQEAENFIDRDLPIRDVNRKLYKCS
jgi:hypothetical protein